MPFRPRRSGHPIHKPPSKGHGPDIRRHLVPAPVLRRPRSHHSLRHPAISLRASCCSLLNERSFETSKSCRQHPLVVGGRRYRRDENRPIDNLCPREWPSADYRPRTHEHREQTSDHCPPHVKSTRREVDARQAGHLGSRQEEPAIAHPGIARFRLPTVSPSGRCLRYGGSRRESADLHQDSGLAETRLTLREVA